MSRASFLARLHRFLPCNRTRQASETPARISDPEIYGENFFCVALAPEGFVLIDLQVLTHGPNPKALFRRAEANAALERFPEAAADARRAISLSPNHEALRALLHRIRSREADFLRAAKASLKSGTLQASQAEREVAEKVSGYPHLYGTSLCTNTCVLQVTDEHLRTGTTSLLFFSNYSHQADALLMGRSALLTVT